MIPEQPLADLQRSLLAAAKAVGDVTRQLHTLTRAIEGLTIYDEDPDGRWWARNPMWPATGGVGLTKHEAFVDLSARITVEHGEGAER